MPRQNTEDSEIPQRRIAPNGYKLPTQLPEGIVVTDICSKQWRFGKPIGLGGFGEIYLASDNVDGTVGQDSEYVAKVEAHSSGPLFVEMNFYLRAARREMVDEWVARKDLKYLGMPFYLGSGSFWHKEEHFRFLVIPRYGQDLEKMFLERGRRFHLKTVLSVGLQVIDILEYVHAQGYVHADIKGSNLLVGEAHGEDDRVFLVDFGLATRYQIEGVHKEFKPDLRKAHDGTLEYTSRDAHQGAHSRRGDLEVLGYNLVQWLCSYLPWEGENANLDPEYIHAQKEGFMKDPAVLVRACFPNSQPPMVLEKYLKYVTTLGFETKPDYEYCRKLFRQGLREAGYKDDGRLQLDSEPIASPPRSRKKAVKKKSSDEPENIAELKPKKVVRVSPAQPCRPKNLNTRATRSSPTSPMLQSREPFDWERVLSSNPEKKFYKQRNPDPNSSPASAAQHQSTLTTRNMKSLPDQRKLRGLENPTPAMLQIMEARKQKSRPTSGQTTPNKRGRSESISLPVEDIPTAAMEEVMQQRQRRCSTPSSVVEQETRRGRGRARQQSATQVRLTRARTILKAAIASVRPRQSSRPATLDLGARLKTTWIDDQTSPTSPCHDEDKVIKHKQEVSLELPSTSFTIVNVRKRVRANSTSAKNVACIVNERHRRNKRTKREEACSEQTPQVVPRRRRHSKKEVESEDNMDKMCQKTEDRSDVKNKEIICPGRRARKIQPEKVMLSASQHVVQEELGTNFDEVKQRVRRRTSRKDLEIQPEEVLPSTSHCTEDLETSFVMVKLKAGRRAAKKVVEIQHEEVVPNRNQHIEDLETPCEMVKLKKGRRAFKKVTEIEATKTVVAVPSTSKSIEDLETPCEIVKLRAGRRAARKNTGIEVEEAIPSTSQCTEAVVVYDALKTKVGRRAARNKTEIKEAIPSTSQYTEAVVVYDALKTKAGRRAARNKAEIVEAIPSTSQYTEAKVTNDALKTKAGRRAARNKAEIEIEEAIPSTSQCTEAEVIYDALKTKAERRAARNKTETVEAVPGTSQCTEADIIYDAFKIKVGRRAARKAINAQPEDISTSQCMETLETPGDEVRPKVGKRAARKVLEIPTEEDIPSTSQIQEDLGTFEEQGIKILRRLRKKKVEKEQEAKANRRERKARKAKSDTENKKIEDKDSFLDVTNQSLDSRWEDIETRECVPRISKRLKKEEMESEVEDEPVKTSRRGRKEELGSDAEENKLRVVRNGRRDETESETEEQIPVRANRKAKNRKQEFDVEERKLRAVKREEIESETEDQLPIRACRRARKEEVDTDNEDLDTRLSNELESDLEERHLRYTRRKLGDYTTSCRTRYARNPLRTDVQYRLKVLMSLDECSTYSPSVASECSGSLYEPSLVDSEDMSSVHSLKVRLYRGGKTPEWRVDRARRGLDMSANVQRRVTRNCGKL